MKQIITIEGMSCGHCAARVEKTLAALSGVTKASVNLSQKIAEIECLHPLEKDVLIQAVDQAGYTAVSVQ